MKVFLMDPEKCTGCRLCELSCSLTRYGAFNRELSAIRVESNEDLSLHVPVSCMQCREAPCIRACVAGALRRDSGTGAVLVDADRCILCKACAVACPFGCVSLVRWKDDPRIGICDLCSGEPQCVSVCRSQAIAYVDEGKVNRKKRMEDYERVFHNRSTES
jgi:carbon-monoxide dehydrogenase iron sulfur subunit